MNYKPSPGPGSPSTSTSTSVSGILNLCNTTYINNNKVTNSEISKSTCVINSSTSFTINGTFVYNFVDNSNGTITNIIPVTTDFYNGYFENYKKPGNIYINAKATYTGSSIQQATSLSFIAIYQNYGLSDTFYNSSYQGSTLYSFPPPTDIPNLKNSDSPIKSLQINQFVPFSYCFMISPKNNSSNAVKSTFKTDEGLIVSGSSDASSFSFTPESITMNTILPSGKILNGGLINVNSTFRTNDEGMYTTNFAETIPIGTWAAQSSSAMFRLVSTTQILFISSAPPLFVCNNLYDCTITNDTPASVENWSKPAKEAISTTIYFILSFGGIMLFIYSGGIMTSITNGSTYTLSNGVTNMLNKDFFIANTGIYPVLSQFEIKVGMSFLSNYNSLTNFTPIIYLQDSRFVISLKYQVLQILYDPNPPNPSPSPSPSPSPILPTLYTVLNIPSTTQIILKITYTGSAIIACVYDTSYNLITYGNMDLSNSSIPGFDLTTIKFFNYNNILPYPTNFVNFTSLNILQNPYDAKVEVDVDGTTVITNMKQNMGFSTPHYQSSLFAYDYDTSTIVSMSDTTKVWTRQPNGSIILSPYDSTLTTQMWSIYLSPGVYPYSIHGLWKNGSTFYDVNENFFQSDTSIIKKYTLNSDGSFTLLSTNTGTRDKYNSINDFTESSTDQLSIDFINWTCNSLNAVNTIFKYYDVAGYWLNTRNNTAICFFPGSTATCFYTIFDMIKGGKEIIMPNPICRTSGTDFITYIGNIKLNIYPTSTPTSSTNVPSVPNLVFTNTVGSPVAPEIFNHCNGSLTTGSSPLGPYVPPDFTVINKNITFNFNVPAKGTFNYKRIFVFMFSDSVLYVSKLLDDGSNQQYGVEGYNYTDNNGGIISITGTHNIDSDGRAFPASPDGAVFTNGTGSLTYKSSMGTGSFYFPTDSISFPFTLI